MHGTLASTIEGIPLKSKLSPRGGRDKNAWERVVSSRIVEQEPGRITIPWRNSIHKYAKFRTTQRRGAVRGVALLKRPFATATSSLAGRSFRFAIDCNIAACTRARHPSLGPAYLRCFSRCYSLEWEARKRAFNVSWKRTSDCRRSRSRFSLSLGYLPIPPLWPTANLTIGNESKKIRSVAFVPDGTPRCATSRGHATPLEERHEGKRKQRGVVVASGTSWSPEYSVENQSRACSCEFVQIRAGSDRFVQTRPFPSPSSRALRRRRCRRRRRDSQSGSVRRTIVAPCGRTRARVPLCERWEQCGAVRYVGSFGGD